MPIGIEIISGVYAIPNSKYTIDTEGNIRSYYQDKINGKLIKQTLDKRGYPRPRLRINKKSVSKRTHRIVAEAFIFNPNNKLENLEWMTNLENVRHGVNMGAYNNRAENCHFSKVTWEQVREMREHHVSKGICKRAPWEKYNITSRNYHSIIAEKTWKEY